MSSPPPALALEGVDKAYGDIHAVRGVDLIVANGAFVALVGASGSGKSTLLKTINRLVPRDGGTVSLHGEPVDTVDPARLRRRIGYVFQQVGLFPHLTVGENVGMVPRLEGTVPTQARLAELLELVELDPGMAGRMPGELSGGQQQRIGIARALAGNPELLLMDEPFGALDPITRNLLGDRVRALHDRLGLTTVLVTHDMAEALLLADRVLVMDKGRIVADATPAELAGGGGGDVAQNLVSVPRDHAVRLAALGDTAR